MCIVHLAAPTLYFYCETKCTGNEVLRHAHITTHSFAS